MKNFNDRELKIIKEFKNYIENFYMDFINMEVIEVYSLQKGLSPEETEILERRFL